MSAPLIDPGKADRQVRLPGVLHRLDRATAFAETPVRRLVGSGRLNPLPHAGTISVFLLIVVTVTGIYLTFFFEFGFADSYRAVSKMEAHPIQRVIRAVHRFSSAALVVTTLVHAWRIFVMQRFTGPRRWRWLTGVLALALVWPAGVTGYWLIWDVRGQALTEAFSSMMGSISGAWEVTMIRPTGTGWVPLLIIFTVHLLLTAVIGYALWRHLRNTRHGWLPPRRWMALMGAALFVAAIAMPLGMLPAADPGVVPGSMPLDPFIMFLLPPLLGSWPWGVAALALAVGVVGMAIPWILRRFDPPVAQIVADRCTGCELCAIDRPYVALTMSHEGEGAIAVEGGVATVIGGFAQIDAGHRQQLAAVDVPPDPGVELGAALFSSAGFGQNLGCEVCHSLDPDERLVGPSLAGIGTVAGDRIPGMTAEEYILQSIVDPDAYTLEGYTVGQMLEDYEERLTPGELQAMVAYLMTLTEAES